MSSVRVQYDARLCPDLITLTALYEGAGIATGYGVDCRGIGVRVPVG
jgi:hypothetical protein